MANEIGSTLSATLPTVSVTAGPDWATLVNVYLLALSDAVEAGVRTAIGLTVDSAVDFNAHEATDVAAVGLTNRDTSLATASRLYERDDELWFNDGAANQVQLTASGALNAASLGGIVGDYGGADPARITYSTSLKTFIFTQDTNKPAKIDAGDFKLREAGTTSPNAVTIKSPASLAAAYTLTMLAALPASASLMEVSSAGVLSTTTAPTLTTLTLSGATLTATSATGSFAALSITASDVSHGTRTMVLGPTLARVVLEWGTAITSDHYIQSAASAAGSLIMSIPLNTGDRLLAVRVICNSAGAVASDMSATLFKANKAVGGASSDAPTTLVGSTNMPAATANIQAITLNPTDTVLGAGEAFGLTISAANSAGLKNLFRVEVDYDRA